jgi:hypothetical protein
MNETPRDPRRSSPPAQRNKDPILAVLKDILPREAFVLEIASGTGEHGAHFAAAVAGWRWQPSDRNDEGFDSIRAWSETVPHGRVRPPLVLDVTAAWPPFEAPPDAVFCANMIHIAPWEATLGLMRGAGAALPPGGALILYGPYHRDGQPTAPGNAAFDESLRARNASWGVRDLGQVQAAAAAAGLAFRREWAMPANNLTLLFRREG